MNLTEIRQQYPQYDNLSDIQLIIELHKKYYPQMDIIDFAQRVGYKATPALAKLKERDRAYEQRQQDNRPWLDKSSIGRMGVSAMQGIANAGLNPAGYVARAAGMNTKPFQPQNAPERVSELFGQYGFDAAAIAATLGGMAQAGIGGTGVTGNAIKSMAEGGIPAAENLAMGSALLTGTLDPKNPYMRMGTDVVGGMLVPSVSSGIGTVGGLFRNNLKKGMDYIRKTKGDEYLQNMIDEATQKGVSLAEVADERGLKMVQMARQQTSAADDIITQNAQAIRDNVPNKNTDTLNDMFGTKSGYQMAQEAEQAAFEKARPMFNDLEAYGDLDPLYVKPGEKIPTGKLSKEQADALLKQEMGKLPTEEQPFKIDLFDTKVIDKWKNPLKVYHGTNAEFDVFDGSKITNSSEGMGFNFTPNRNIAEGFGNNVKEAYLNLKNPVNAMDEIGGSNQELQTKLNNVVKKLKEKGYDFYDEVNDGFLKLFNNKNTNWEVYDNLLDLGSFIKNDYNPSQLYNDIRKATIESFGVDGYYTPKYNEAGDEVFVAFLPEQIIPANKMPTTKRYKGGNEIAVAKSIRRNMSKNDYDFQWRKDENGNYDYQHFTSDKQRTEYLPTFNSTYKNPQYVVNAPNKENLDRTYLMSQYLNPQDNISVYDKIVIDPKDGQTLTKIAREGRVGRQEFAKEFRKGQVTQASEYAPGLSQTGNAPSSTLQVDSNIPSLGEVVNSNNVINSAIKSVKGAYSSLKGLPDTDARVILETRKLLSRQTKSPDATLAYQAKQALKEFDDALPADFRKGLEEANKIYKDNYQFTEAKEGASDVFKANVSPEEFSDKFGKMTAEEKRALRGGLRDELFSIIENRANETLGWNRVVPRAVQSKIRRVMGVEEGNKLIEYAQGQLKSMRNLNKILGGSNTAEKLDAKNTVSTAVEALGNPTGSVGIMLKRAPWNDARNKGIAELMTNPSADLARATYEQVASPRGWEAVYQALYNPRGFTRYNTALAAYLAGRELQQ